MENDGKNEPNAILKLECEKASINGVETHSYGLIHGSTHLFIWCARIRIYQT